MDPVQAPSLTHHYQEANISSLPFTFFSISSWRVHTSRKGSCFSLKPQNSFCYKEVYSITDSSVVSEAGKLARGKSVSRLHVPLARKVSSCFELAQVENLSLLCFPSCLEVGRG